MIVEKNKAITITYSLADADGQILDSSDDNGALTYLHGTGFLVPGLEQALDGQAVGYELSAVLKPGDAYGEYDEALIFQASKTDIIGEVDLYEGLEFEAEINRTVRLCTIAAIDGDKVTVDANHPLAGETLHVQATIIAIRAASPEEIKHGHIREPNDDHDHSHYPEEGRRPVVAND